MAKKGSNRTTVAAGAVIARDLLQRKLRRELRRELSDAEGTYEEGYRHALQQLTQWLRDQPRRTRRPGGIGRR
jgi:hypothetical protein